MVLMRNLHDKVLHSKVEDSLSILIRIWDEEPNAIEILESLHPTSLFTFSHKWSTIHVPKEHEYLIRLMPSILLKEQIDFLERFVEYLSWAPKYVHDETSSYASGVEDVQDLSQRYLSSMAAHRVPAALHYALEMAENDSLEDVLRLMLQVGCNDISQAIGHYFSCTESVVRLAMRAGMPKAKNHIFLLTTYLMQSSPIIRVSYSQPARSLDEVLTRLVRKGGFAGYHYMILVNGLIQNRDFLGERHYLHALQGLETILPTLSDTLSTGKLDELMRGVPESKPREPLKMLKKHIWKGETAEAFMTLRRYLQEHGLTEELKVAIAHSFTKIDDRPHDPHYVTFPASAFELASYLKDDRAELVLAHAIEFAIERVQQYGIIA